MQHNFDPTDSFKMILFDGDTWSAISGAVMGTPTAMRYLQIITQGVEEGSR